MSDYLYHHFHVLFELLRAYVRRLSFLEKDRFVHLLGEEARAILEQGDERERERERGEGVLTCVHIRTYVKNVLFELIDGHFMCGCRNLKFYRARCRMRATEPRKEECAISRHDFPLVRCTSEIQMHEAGEAGVHRETVFGG